MTPVEQARQNLEQVMRYKPQGPLARKQKAANEKALVAYIERLEAEAS